MPSVRVRRGSQYTTLSGSENGDQNDERGTATGGATRPRSRTIASIYSSFRQSAQAQEADTSGASPSQLRPERPFNSLNRSSKVEDAIKKQASRTLRPSDARRSFSPSGGHSGRASYEYDRDHSDVGSRPRDSVILEGSQADVVVPRDGPMGRVGSALSVTDSHVDSFDDSSTDELNHHEDEIVEHLDVIDPQIATISNLANAANAILIPPIGVYSRKPVVVLPKPSRVDEGGTEKGEAAHENELDLHIEEVLSRQQKVRRTLRGVWSFIKTPMGIVVAIYGFLVVFWGAAIVFFLARFINFHNSLTQGFWVEVSAQIENALFTVTGVGLLPWRLIDTYRILRIWHFKKLTRKLRRKAGLPELYDEDDLPDPLFDPNYVHVLSEKQQKELTRMQRRFMRSQTWYRPHGTETHRAFPINTALLICLFIDGNSFFQCILCGTMWGLNRFQRPAWSTGLLIPFSFLCGIIAAVLIWHGGQKTKRTKEVTEKLRMALAVERRPELCAYVDTVVTKDAQEAHIKKPPKNERRATKDSTKSERSASKDEGNDFKRTYVGGHNSSILIEEEMEIPSHVLPHSQ